MFRADERSDWLRQFYRIACEWWLVSEAMRYSLFSLGIRQSKVENDCWILGRCLFAFIKKLLHYNIHWNIAQWSLNPPKFHNDCRNGSFRSVIPLSGTWVLWFYAHTSTTSTDSVQYMQLHSDRLGTVCKIMSDWFFCCVSKTNIISILILGMNISFIGIY